MQQDIRFTVIGRRSGLPDAVLKEMDESILLSRDNHGMCLCLAINYGARTEIVDAVRALAHQVKQGQFDPDSIDEADDFRRALYRWHARSRSADSHRRRDARQ